MEDIEEEVLARAKAVCSTMRREEFRGFSFRAASHLLTVAAVCWVAAFLVDATGSQANSVAAVALRLFGSLAVAVFIVLRLWRKRWHVHNPRMPM